MKTDDAKHLKKSQPNDLILALVQYGTQPAAVVIVALLVFTWLMTAGTQLSVLKGPGFEAKFDRDVEKEELQSELRSLRTLTKDQLQLFLIVGRDRNGQKIDYTGPEATDENWEALATAGLLTFRDIGDKRVEFTITRKAYLLHVVLLDNLYRSIQE